MNFATLNKFFRVRCGLDFKSHPQPCLALTSLVFAIFVVAVPIETFAQTPLQRPGNEVGNSPTPANPLTQTPLVDPNLSTNQSTDSTATQDNLQSPSAVQAQPSQFDPAAAFEHLKAICKIGPRVSASVGMKKQQRLIKAHFDSLGGKLYTQPFKVRSPYTQKFVQLDNIIIQFHPERKKRLLLCCHHDTRPFPDADPINPRGTFIGANDGASGVALLMEMGRHLKDMKGDFGVDLIFFDGEEFVIQRQRDPMFLGSTHFSNEYAAGKIGWKYEYGILVDLVADKDLQIYFEGNSLGYADGLTRSVWSVAKELGVKEFIPEQRHKIRDDHLPLNSIARIQTVDIIDFDYPNPTAGNAYWHTQKDVVENCSAESLGKVGKVVLEWVRQVQKLNSKKPNQGDGKKDGINNGAVEDSKQGG